MKNFVLLLFALLCLQCFSQTNVTANIFSNTNWTQANSPYIIKNDIIIYGGAKLTVDAGVEIKVDNGFKIDLRGELALNGSVSDSILIRSSLPSPANNAWYGVQLNASGKIKINYSIFKDSEYGIDYWNSALTLADTSNIIHSRFTHNNWALGGFGLNRPRVYIKMCTFNINTRGIWGGESENVYVSKCSFFNNKGGIGDSVNGGGLNIHIDSCNFFNNMSGAGVNFHAAGSLTNSNFYNNSIRGLYLVMDGYNYPFANNRIYNNPIGIYCFGNSPSMDSLNGGNSAICSNTINFYNTTTRNFKIKNICWCTDDSSVIRSTIKDGYNTSPLGLVLYSPYNKECSLSSPQKINEYNLVEDLNLFPNPTNANIFFNSLKDFSGYTIKIYDINGKLMYENKLIGNNIDVKFLATGIYNLVISSESNLISKKIIKTGY